jgi:hypothetical protein
MFRVVKEGGQVVIVSEPCQTSTDLIRRWIRDRISNRRKRNFGVFDKLPDEHFAHTWPEFREWISEFTEEFRIIPAGGSAAMVEREGRLIYESQHRDRTIVGKVLNRVLPDHRGFRGDIHIVATKTRRRSNRNRECAFQPVEAGDFEIHPLEREEIELHRELFIKMFPFPVEI